jgi:hypothetical protein
VAFSQVEFVAPKVKTRSTPAKTGGGREGMAIGMALGAAGGPGAAMTGGALGNTLGEALVPGTPASQSSAMNRRVDAQGAKVFHSKQSDELKQSLLALNQAPPEMQAAYKAPLAQAYATSVALDNPAQKPQQAMGRPRV